MDQEAVTAEVRDIMIEFADQTGISTTKNLPRRYLWTDAFAVCDFLTLYRLTDDEEYLSLARALIDQVHNILGRHREDDPRAGWISGLSEVEGQSHPTAGGLRIGKTLNERGPNDPYDDRLEWDRDGQYFHYLTKWMHALERAGGVTGDPDYCRWAVELAQAAHAGFTYAPLAGGPKRMHWKMRIDLSHPLVPSMGLHDPLDGFITFNELRICAQRLLGGQKAPDLGTEIAETAKMCDGREWETDDPLGIGGLLFDACRVLQMTAEGNFKAPGLLKALLGASKYGLDAFVSHYSLNDPTEYRLAFRELGLAIGLKAVAKMRNHLMDNSSLLEDGLPQQIESLVQYVPLSGFIEDFWRNPASQQTKSWLSHRDINMVMLATSLSPGEFLSL